MFLLPLCAKMLTSINAQSRSGSVVHSTILLLVLIFDESSAYAT